ncbi:MAG: benzoate-CoA ligase family protein [Alphaproteobacteria bacterium]
MPDNSVAVDRSTTPATLRYSARFNAAAPFIDRHIGEGRGGKIAFRAEGGEEVSYAALAANVNRCGNALKSLGIAPGERLLMVVKDCPEFLYLFWGAIKAGIVPVPLNTLLRAENYRSMIEDSGCAAVVHSPEFAGEVADAIAGAAHKPGRVLPAEGADSIQALMRDAPDRLAPAPASADDDCFWLFSSGSTGRPKAAVHRHRDMVVTSQRFGVETLGIGEDDVCFSAAKLFFAYGLGNSMTFPLWVGASAVLSDRRPSPEMTFEIIEKFKPTIYFGVPTLFAATLRALEDSEPDLRSLRTVCSAGEALPPDILRRWRERTGLLILDGFGSTETLHICVANRPGDYRVGTSGRAVPGYQGRIVGEDGETVVPGETGALMIKGESIARCYWNDPERTARTMVGDWIHTGDTYFQDADGYYVYCGRNDDMMKVGGIWCSPFEIESRLVEHSKVLEAAVVGRADDDALIKPEAGFVLQQAGDAEPGLEQELLEHCKDGLARYKYPRWFNFVDDLPKTATGKIQRFKLRAAGQDNAG